MKARFMIFLKWWGTTAADYFMLGLIYAGLFRAAEQKDWFDFWLMVAASIFILLCMWIDKKSKTRQLSEGDDAQIMGVGPALFVHAVDKKKDDAVVIWYDSNGVKNIGLVSTSLLTKVSK